MLKDLNLSCMQKPLNVDMESRTDQFVLEAVDIGKVGVDKGRNKQSQPLY